MISALRAGVEQLWRLAVRALTGRRAVTFVVPMKPYTAIPHGLANAVSVPRANTLGYTRIPRVYTPKQLHPP